jgi:hypothetical protein
MKTYVITAEVSDNCTTPYKLPDWFDPSEMCYVFRLVDADGEPLYYGLTSDSSSFDAQDDYETYVGCTGTQLFNFLTGEWDPL